MAKHYRKELISLGENCEPDFKIRKFDRNAKSYAYSWAAIHDRGLFLASLSDLDGLLEGEVTKEKSAIVEFSHYQAAFHLRPQYIDETDVVPEEGLKELMAREKHLIEKTKRLYEDEGADVCFLQAVKSLGFEEDAAYVSALSKHLFSLCRSPKVLLVLVFEEKGLKIAPYKKMETERVKIRFVHRFAEPKDRGDLYGWLAILKEFGAGSTLRYIYSDSPICRFLFRPFVALRHALKKRRNL
jgi:hypothetical protein